MLNCEIHCLGHGANVEAFNGGGGEVKSGIGGGGGCWIEIIS